MKKFQDLYCRTQCNLKTYNLPSFRRVRRSGQFTIFSSQRQGGFTLIELIIVLVIIALASGLVGIFIHRGSDKLELKTVTKYMAATLRRARSRAIAEKKVYSFIIQADKRAYGLYADLPHSGELEDAVPVIYETIPESLQIIFESRNDYFRIDFYPRGNSSGGTVKITNQKGKIFSIKINRITGSVKIKKPV